MTSLGLAGLASLVGLVAFGSIIPVVPTGALVSAGAVLAKTERPWELAVVVLAGAAGAYLGDIVTYTVLRAAGSPLAQRIGWLRADDPDSAIRTLRARLERNQARSLLLARLVPAGRIPVLLAAALGGYPVLRFAGANVGAVVLWSATYAAIGVIGDAFIPDPRIAVLVVVVAALLVTLVPSLLRRRRGAGR
ncbi:MAG: VTT domain-containing protein [Nocardioides sp.]|uniref:DedA family protein n=1 Tax=Nocardioides sp. TaxID=35761 RepID=UPI0039E446D4